MKWQSLLRQERREAWSGSGMFSAAVGRRAGCGAIRGVWGLAVCMMWMVLVPRLSAALPPIGTPTPTPTPHATVDFHVMYQDLDGRAGLVPSVDYPSSPTARTRITVRQLGYPIGYSSTWFSDPFYDPVLSGTPFDFEADIPGVGVYRGTSYLDVYFGDPYYYTSHPYFVVPTTSQKLGQEMSLGIETGAPSGGQSMAIRFTPYVCNASSGPGYSVHLLTGPNHHPSIEFTVTQLATDSTTVTVTQRHTLYVLAGLGILIPQDTLYWGSGLWWDDDHSWRVGYEIPPPPVTLSAHVDGYSTETITLTTLMPTIFEWNALLRPLPDRPDVYRPTGLSIYWYMSYWMKTTIDAITWGILRPRTAEDQNSDTVLDVGDILTVLNQEPDP